MLVNNDHEFEGICKSGLQADGTFCDTTAAFAPYQNGICERQGGTWKRAFVQAIDSLDPKDRAEVDELIDQMNVAINTLPRLDGHYPHQRVPGKESKLLIGLELDVPLTVETSTLSIGENMYEKCQTINMRVKKGYIEAHEEDRLKCANNHRNRPSRGSLQPGDMVYFWRHWHKDKKTFWHGPGTVVGCLDDRSRIWVDSGTKMDKCSPEQLRHVSHEEEIIEDMRVVRNNMRGRGAGTYGDLSGGPFPHLKKENLREEELRENENDSDDNDRRVGARISNIIEDEQQDSEMPHDPGNNNSEIVIDVESGQCQQSHTGLTIESASNEPKIPAVTIGSVSVPASEHDGAPDSVNEPEEECIPLMTEQPVGSASMNEFSNPGIPMMGESHLMDQGSNQYGPVRSTTLRDAMKHNLDLLDMGRLPRRN